MRFTGSAGLWPFEGRLVGSEGLFPFTGRETTGLWPLVGRLTGSDGLVPFTGRLPTGLWPLLSRFTTGGGGGGGGALETGVGFFIDEDLDVTDGFGVGVVFVEDERGLFPFAEVCTGRLVVGFEEVVVEVEEEEDEETAEVTGFFSRGISAICFNSFGIACLLSFNVA